MEKVRITLYGTHKSTKEYDLNSKRDLETIRQLEKIYGKENISYENK